MNYTTAQSPRREKNALRPVSYTHLDVYKRQVRDRDTMEQVRLPIDKLKDYIEEKVAF